ncbi:MAG: Flp pilus assembly complex ATPase component TadA [Candidatus Omnitrophica bacterium]|nr:Flp pilus assembly complex ATPase component TadA [Candidatus Omnitrophota bacterium]
MEKLGQILLKMGAINEKQLSTALAESKKTGEIFGKVVRGLGYITEEQLLLALSKQFDVPYYPTLRDVDIPEDVIKAIPVKFVWHYKFVPLAIKDNVLTLAISDPLEIWSTEDIKLLLGYGTDVVLTPSSEVLEAIHKYYGVGAETVQKILEEKGPEEEKEISSGAKVEDIEKTAGGASVIKLVDQIFMSAIKSQATDIHLEAYHDKVKIRCRVDGILYDLALPSEIKQLYPAMISRIKIISGLDVVEKRIPQDGRVKIKFHGSEIDLRISVIPVSRGENIVIRILPSEMVYDINELGFLKDELDKVKTIIHMPIGVIFLAGPTGSGKTTTLYTCLTEIKSSDTKIITVEDPMEYEMDDIMQIQISPKVGLTFASALRSILRHDPDIIMIGEVRDRETAELAVRSALTGHLIFSTIHTNDATSGVARLVDMGIEPFLLVSAVKVFIAQRLVRIVCKKCKEEHSTEGVSNVQNIPVKRHFKGKGCDECRYTGYRGRTAIHEVFILDKEIQEMVLKGASSQNIRKKARENGMRTLRENGWIKVEEGVTSIEEVLRVTDTDER